MRLLVYDMKINIRHGNGGRETAGLINGIFMPYFGNASGTAEEDAAVLNVSGPIAFTTDSFVVRPIFFNGGDIGRLAICGTVNDLLTSGAVPKYLSAGFIIEEGFDTEDLQRIARSMREAADEAGVLIVTGDTKVIEGAGGVYINTAGVGVVSRRVSFKEAEDGDAVIVTGTLGDHHACITSARMGVKNNIKSDAAPLTAIVQALQAGGVALHGLRDITRGGLATCLHEISTLTGLEARIYERMIPVTADVSGLCGILGLDPLYMANEGKMVMAVPPSEASRALDIIKSQPYGSEAVSIGELKQTGKTGVVMTTKIGGTRLVPPLTGESLPRIC